MKRVQSTQDPFLSAVLLTEWWIDVVSFDNPEVQSFLRSTSTIQVSQEKELSRTQSLKRTNSSRSQTLISQKVGVNWVHNM